MAHAFGYGFCAVGYDFFTPIYLTQRTQKTQSKEKDEIRLVGVKRNFFFIGRRIWNRNVFYILFNGRPAILL